MLSSINIASLPSFLYKIAPAPTQRVYSPQLHNNTSPTAYHPIPIPMILTRSLSLGLICALLLTTSLVSASDGDDMDTDIVSKQGRGGTRPPPGPGGPRPLQCTNPGFVCRSALIFQAPATNISPLYRGGGGGGDVQSEQYICSAADAFAIKIASCPQGECQQNYCVGGGPATVPDRLPAGSGLYCGKTINAQYVGFDQGQGVGTFGGGGGRGGGDGGVGRRTSRGEYVHNNLYYFVGKYGVNLGPCPYQCINAGPGIPDYCATSPTRF